MKIAEVGLEELRQAVDAIIVIPNDRLLSTISKETTAKNAFAMCDDVLKSAVEGISESLATEVKPLGIDVLIVEPGPFRTNWAGPSIKESTTQIDDYAATAGERRKQTAARSGNQAGDPVRAAQAIIDAALSDRPPLRLLLGKTALELARKKLDLMRNDFDTWESTTIGADFPDGAS